jgi:hypothetical protein
VPVPRDDRRSEATRLRRLATSLPL